MACRIFDCNRLCGLSILRHLCRTHAEQFFCWARASVLLGWFLPFFHIKHLQDGRQRLIDHSSLWPKPFTKANTVHHQSSFHPAPSSCKKKAEEMLRREPNKKGTGGKMSYGNCWRDPINGWCWVGSCRGLFLYQLPSRYLVIEFQRLWFPADVELIRLPQSTGQQEKWRRKVSAGNL